MKLWLLVSGLCLTMFPGWGAEERISVLLRSMVDGGPVPTEKVFYETIGEDYINQLSADSITELLPLARTLLHDSRPEARRYGLMCFFAVTLRFSDGEPLLEPYVSDLLSIVDNRANPIRPMAMEVLGNMWPRLSPKTLAYLAAHLADKDNAAEDTGWMACTLLRASSDSMTHDVIAFLRKQDKPEVTVRVLMCFHALPPTKNADALAFIGSSLDSPDASTRRNAVEAVADLPLAERSPFLAQLSRLSTDSKEPKETRSAAAEALKK